MNKLYNLNTKCKDKILEMLNDKNKTFTIQQIFDQIKSDKLFDGKIGAFRQRVDANFRRVSEGSGEKYVIIDHYEGTLLDLSYNDNDSKEKDTETDTSEAPIPSELENKFEQGKAKISNTLNIVSPNNDDPDTSTKSPPTLERLNQNIDGALFKINLMEAKIKHLDKKIDILNANIEKALKISEKLSKIFNPKLFD